MDASGPATRRRVANEALNSSVRTRSMTSGNLASLAEAPKARRPPSSREPQQHRRGPTARPVDGSRIARRLGRGVAPPTSIPGPSPVKPTLSMGPPERRMPLLPKSPEQQGASRTANPFDLTSPGKRPTMIFRSPGQPRPSVLADGPLSDDDDRDRDGPRFGFGTATPASASKRPRSPSPVFSSSPQRPFRPLGSAVRPGSFLHPPSVGRLPSSSPLADRTYDGDLTPRTKKARHESVRDPEAMELDDPLSSVHRFRPPSSEGPDIGSLDLASPTRFREPRPLIFGGTITPSRPIAPPPTIRTTHSNAGEADSTTPPGSPPMVQRSPFRVPRPLGSVFGTMIISPRRVSPIKEATMPTDIPLRSPSPERRTLSPSLDAMMEDGDDMPSSKFLGTGIFSVLASNSSLPPSSSLSTAAVPPLSRSTAGTNSLESIEEERSPIKHRPDGSFPRPPSSSSVVAPTAPSTTAAAARNSTLKSKYRGLAGATIPRPPPSSAPAPVVAPVAANTRSGTATTFRGIPRAGSVTGGLSSVSASASSSSSTAGAGAAPSRAQDTNDRLAKLQAMLDKMSSGRRPSLNPPPVAANSGPPLAASSGMGRIGRGLPSSSSSTGLASSSSGAEGVVTRRRSSSSGSTTKPPSTTQVFSRSGAPLGSSLSSSSTTVAGASGLRSSVNGGPRRASQILPPSTTFARLDASTGPEAATRSKEGPLREVVAFVDVRTAEGDDAGQVFVEMLKGLGAKVVTRPTCPLTHIVFKGGKPGTIDRWCAHAEPKPVLVGIGWVVRCREVMARADETPYVVEVTKEAVQGKRRRTMEPKALALANAGLSMSTSALVPAGRPNVAASIEQAKRKSLQFAPKVGSPLARRMFDASSLLHASSDDD